MNFRDFLSMIFLEEKVFSRRIFFLVKKIAKNMQLRVVALSVYLVMEAIMLRFAMTFEGKKNVFARVSGRGFNA